MADKPGQNRLCCIPTPPAATVAGCARQAFAKSENEEEKTEQRQAFEKHVACGLELGGRACWLLADHIRDDSDRGQLAAFNQFCLREVREKAEGIQQELD